MAVKRREAEILEAGIAVFAEKGYAATTIQDIADRVGVLKGSLYYYIESKEDLLFRIGCRTNSEAAEILHQCQAQPLEPLEKVQVYLTRYLEWYLTNFTVVSLYLSEWVNLTGERRAIGIKLRHEFEDFIRDQIRQAQRDGTVAEDLDPKLASFAILGAVNSVSTWWKPRSRYSVHEVAQNYARMAIGLVIGFEHVTPLLAEPDADAGVACRQTVRPAGSRSPAIPDQASRRAHCCEPALLIA